MKIVHSGKQQNSSGIVPKIALFLEILTHLVLLIFLFWDLGMVRSLLGRLCQLLRSEEAIGKHTIGPLVVRFQADALF